MRLTAKSEYGLLAVIDLALSSSSGPVSAREVAERRAIPQRFLEQLLVSLRRAGLVTAVRGAKGGFALGRPAEEITVLDVVEALEGSLTASVCDSERGVTCGQAGACAAAPVWAKATAALRDVFAGTTIEELAGSQSRLDGMSERACDNGKPEEAR
jgi:Rrf2 family protein